MNDWDLKFMAAAREFGQWSKCFSRKIGAILVRDRTIISTGYNGPPRGVPHCNESERIEELKRLARILPDLTDDMFDNLAPGGGCPRKAIGVPSGTLLNLCPAGHAESNAISNAARIGVITKDSVMYCYCPMPCFECAKTIINAGIREVICLEGEYDSRAKWLFNHSNIPVRAIDYNQT